MNSLVNLLDYDRAALGQFFVELGEKAFRADQVVQWIHQQGLMDFDAMSNLSKALRQRLKETAEIRLPEIVWEQAAADGTRKWLLRLDSGNCIETVYIPETNRGTLCVSSQVGCALDCQFCATAQQGFNRNLTTAEIISQVMIARDALRDEPRERVITNVVMMGMGEPLLNFDNVVKAANLMMDDLAYGLSKRRVTLSTAGVVPALRRLKQVCDLSLAVSIHAPNNELRDQIVPLNKKYPIEELVAACREYMEGHTHRSITWEYVMLDGVNDLPEHARQLAKLLRGIPSKINLIPFNPFPGTKYQRSPDEAIYRFQTILMEAGYTTTIRRTRGEDIDAACGQLAGRVMDRTKRRLRAQQEAANA